MNSPVGCFSCALAVVDTYNFVAIEYELNPLWIEPSRIASKVFSLAMKLKIVLYLKIC